MKNKIHTKMVIQNYFQDVFDSLPQNAALNLPVFKENSMEIKYEAGDEIKTTSIGLEPPLPFANSDVYYANILQWRRLTAVDKGCKAVYEVTFDTQDSNFTFKAGDTIGIIPQNDEADVNFILTHLDLTSVADSCYALSLNTTQKGSKIPVHIPVKSSLRHVLIHRVDLRSVLKKLFLLELSRYTKDENERRILEYFCSKEGSNAYQTHILNRNLCLLDLFAIFKTCKPPIQTLLANLPRLLPRPYSIVNSGLKNGRCLKICFSVMPLQNNRNGLTTGWLERLILNQDCYLDNKICNLTITNGCDVQKYRVPFYLRKNLSNFLLPENIEAPLILIGRGTGVSPFIGFLEERELYRDKNLDINPGEVWLFFGCRNPKLDFIYEKELNKFVENGALTKLCPAFSRVENSNKYIQVVLKQNSKVIAQLIESNASIFVCGDLKNMAVQVKETIAQCLVSSDKSLDEANRIICNLQKEKKYVVDSWS